MAVCVSKKLRKCSCIGFGLVFYFSTACREKKDPPKEAVLVVNTEKAMYCIYQERCLQPTHPLVESQEQFDFIKLICEKLGGKLEKKHCRDSGFEHFCESADFVSVNGRKQHYASWCKIPSGQ